MFENSDTTKHATAATSGGRMAIDPSPRNRGPLFVSAIVLSTALFMSGAAALVNQVVWQRSLKVYLGGGETICSMIVVLVFMAGLGGGSTWMGTKVIRFRHPLFALGLMELSLALVNTIICALLSYDISDSVYFVQRVADSIHIPLLLVYGTGAILVLIVPCFLMGATMPLAAEVCQRHFGAKQSRFLGLLFFINTLGSAAGSVGASGATIPRFGLTWSMTFAALMNLCAAAALCLLAVRSGGGSNRSLGDVTVDRPTVAGIAWRVSPDNVLAFGLGFCSLSYEMLLFRLIPLRHEPLPFTFAAVLSGFLLFWTIGAALSSLKDPWPLSFVLRLCAPGVAASIAVFAIEPGKVDIVDMWSLSLFVIWRFPYFLPCLLFGYAFGLVTRRAARAWGSDVGRVSAWNTCGSCLGVIATTFLGYEMPFFAPALVIALLLFALHEYAIVVEPGRKAKQGVPRWSLPLVAAGSVAAAALMVDLSWVIPNQRTYCGRDGIVMVGADGAVTWDGLWHSELANGDQYIGTNNWFLGVCPIICHPSGDIRDVCVIGVGTGITAGTIAKLGFVERLDGYDITQVLKQVYRDYPAETLHVATNPRINLIWQDARTGLALNPQQYDLIQTQPLYLKQAGSSLLNSVDFYRLVASRLKPGGVFCLYANGTAEQAYAIRQTAALAFSHGESFFNGYLLVLSPSPIALDETEIERRLALDDPLWREIRQFPCTASGSAVLKMIDRPRLFTPSANQLIITDNHPILEYPAILEARVQALGFGDALPLPLVGHH